MEYLLFPSEYERDKSKEIGRLNNEAQKVIDRETVKIKNNYAAVIDGYQKQKQKADSEFLSKYHRNSFSDYLHALSLYHYGKVVLWSIIPGCVISVIVYLVLVATKAFAVPFMGAYAVDILTFLFGALTITPCTVFFYRVPCGYIFGTLFGFIGYPIYQVIYDKVEKKRLLKQQSLNKQISVVMEQKSAEIEQMRQKIISRAKPMIQEIKTDISHYENGFTQKVQQMSVDLANSALAQEVVDWLTSGFLRTIQAFNRAPHVEQITVPFDFQVYKDRIFCNIGTYSFEEHRCAKLRDAVSQAALAKAIANQIQINIVMQYPQDQSGTKYKIDIDCQYPGAFSGVSLKYSALNGHYKPIQNW
jgi:hypothetical protein